MATPVSYPHLPVAPSQRPFIRIAFLTALLLFAGSTGVLAQGKRAKETGSHSSHLRERMTPEARVILERAIEVVCTERKKDPKGSVPIDDMQARPSLPVRSPEALAGAQ